MLSVFAKITRFFLKIFIDTDVVFMIIPSSSLPCMYLFMISVSSNFFFQAEDGIRGTSVTGVQTCALPISAAKSPELFLVVRPGEIHIVRAARLGEMVSEERRVLIRTGCFTFEPVCEGRVQLRSSRPRHARVRYLARDRVLEDVFVFAVELRVRTTANEIALRERLKRGFAASEERPHRTVPEDTSDHGRRLQGVLLGWLEQVDPGSNDRVN